MVKYRYYVGSNIFLEDFPMNDMQDYKKYFLDIYSPVEFIPIRGHGSRLYDKNNFEVIDFAGGVAVNSLGLTNQVLIDVLHEQSQKLWHVGNVMTNYPQIELAKKLVNNSDFDKVFLCNSGTEAVESALKLARRYAIKTYGEQKHNIVSFYQSYHGRTLFAVSAGGQAKYWDGFEPLPSGINHGKFNDINELDELINHATAAVILEPIQAEGGVIPATKEFLVRVRELCDKFNCTLIFDEVQTGLGRTGRLFAYQWHDVIPDVITLAKALGGGFPMGAMLCKAYLSSGFEFASHGATFGGNPLASAVASKAFDLIINAVDGVNGKSDLFMTELNKINNELHIYKEIRGKGLIIGAELSDKYQNKASQIIEFGFKNGVSLLNAGANVSRFLPSLIIPDEDIKEGMQRLYNALQEFKKHSDNN